MTPSLFQPSDVLVGSGRYSYNAPENISAVSLESACSSGWFAWRGGLEGLEAGAVKTPVMPSLEAALCALARLEALHAAAHRGAVVLDVLRPGWPVWVNACELDLSRISGCVLRQVFGSFERGLEALGLDGTDVTALAELGLAISDEEAASRMEIDGRRLGAYLYEELTAAWRRMVREAVLWRR